MDKAQRGARKRGLALGGGSLAILLLSGLGWGVFGTRHDVGTVALTQWAWHIDVEHWERVRYSGESSAPAGSYNVSSYEETDTYTDSDGNEQETTSTYYDYDLDEWIPWRTFSQGGVDKKPIPPEYELPTLPSRALQPRQCQLGDSRRTFRIVVDSGEKAHIWDTDEAGWRPWSVGDLCEVNLNGFGNVRRLEKLQSEAE